MLLLVVIVCDGDGGSGGDVTAVIALLFVSWW